jgi:hypothetical protein
VSNRIAEAVLGLFLVLAVLVSLYFALGWAS